MDHDVTVVLVALLAVLAGCGGGAGPTDATDTATDAQSTAPTTPTPTPTSTPTTTPTPDGSAIERTAPPGVTADGVNLSATLAAHDRRLNRTSYVLDLTVRRGSATREVHVATAADPVPTYVRFEEPNGTREIYYEEQFYQRDERNGNVTYRHGPFVGRPGYTGADVIRQYASRARYHVANTSTRDGVPVVVLAAGPDDLAPDAFGSGTVSDFVSKIAVDEQGVVRSFVFSAVGRTADGRPFVVRVRLSVTGVGTTTVPEPDWVSRARESGGNATDGWETDGAATATATTTTA